MKNTTLRISSVATALVLSAGAAFADCPTEVADPFDIAEDEVVALYDCISDKMIEGYTKGDNETAANYRNWTNSATRPAVQGAHQERFLQTFANDVAAEQYLKFAYEDVVMPTGSILAKESFRIRKGKAVVGPLFIMEKVGLDNATDYGGWLYSGVLPNGKPLKIKQAFCHDCHVAWEAQDHLAYPVEEVRVSASN